MVRYRTTLSLSKGFFQKLWTRHRAFLIFTGVSIFALWLVPAIASAATAPTGTTVPIPQISFGVGQAKNPHDVATSLQILLLLTVLSLAPTLLVLLTSFTRVIVVLSFVRTALGTQQVPPNQVLVGLALFLTFFIMAPVVKDVNQNALQPYLKNQMSQSVALDRAAQPLRKFMFKQTREKDLQLFFSLSNQPRPATQDDVPTYVLIPAFVISELKTAFEIGFAIYVPFIVIDMVVASILLSMGMMMIPPVIISLPFKILIFLLVDGWNLTVNAIFQSYR
jgi:flagellar biosynthetic protein FliP